MVFVEIVNHIQCVYPRSAKKIAAYSTVSEFLVHKMTSEYNKHVDKNKVVQITQEEEKFGKINILKNC